MKRNNNLTHRLVAYVLLVGLFLQSCGNSFNQVVPQRKEQTDINPKSSKQIAKQLIEQKLTTEGWEINDFYEEKHGLQVNATEKHGNFSKIHNLSIYISEDIDLEKVSQLSLEEQNAFTHIPGLKTGQPSCVVICKGGILGGMIEGDVNSPIKKLTEIIELRPYFKKKRGYLELTPQNYEKLMEYCTAYESSFMNYEGGVFINGWKDSQELNNLGKLLDRFNTITKLSVCCDIQDKVTLTEVLAGAIQFYKELIELNLNDCGLGDVMMEDILESIAGPDKLNILNVSNNNLSTELVANLQARFLNAQVRSQGESTQNSITFGSMTSSNNSEGSSSENLTPTNSFSSTLDSLKADKVETSEKEKEKESISGIYLPEVTVHKSPTISAYRRLYLNQFLSTISKDEIKYGRELGRGGFGAVYQASYQGEIVAVKKLLNTFEKQVADFKKEVIIMANHRHNNIVAFLGYCPEEHALVMEYMPGGSLSSLLKSSEDISWQVRYQIALDVAEGVNYLHDCGIVHCDLKSDNILLDDNRRAKVTDFGISALKSENSTFGERSGWSYRWVAPEIFLTNKNSRAGDVYSYGMILWQLGARREPFTAISNLIELTKHISVGNREVISNDTPMEIRNVIELCWLPEPPLKKEMDTQRRPEMKKIRYLLEGIDLALLGKEYQHLDETVSDLLSRAQGGDITAQYQLGLIYEMGRGVTKDYQEAAKWYEKAAEQGYVDAQFKLGSIYYMGLGWKQDYKQAFKCYEKAANQGSVLAQNWMGILYNRGHGVPQDYLKAKEWYEKAANQGEVGGQYNLGDLYYNGQGVAQDYKKARWWYKKAANQGYSIAQNRMGILYYNGQGVTQNYSKALKWYKKAANQGNALAQSWMGILYYNGQGVTQDYNKAKEWYEKAANQGNALAQNWMGILYYRGHGVSQDYLKAKEWYEKAADQGYALAQNWMGILYYRGHGVLQDYLKAKEWYEKAANQGELSGQYNLGDLYYNGYGVGKDYSKAKEWYEKAANQGNALAQNWMGILYNRGHGIPQDYLKAKEWYEKAAAQGEVDSQYNLGNLYYNGQGVRQNYKRAREWYEKAANQGYAIAQSKMGILYYNGQGITQDYNKALKWYQKAANQGNALAQNWMGILYYRGHGVLQDYLKAKEWYEKAANQGEVDGQYNLGDLYYNGYGVGKDYTKAKEWYERAANQGYALAQSKIKELEDRLRENNQRPQYSATSQITLGKFRLIIPDKYDYATKNN